ncbi:MAG: 4Fe-4S binding protein [Bacteroidaceae bacterium]|nr:4Fe-4S binding protein [Bacteroidaceae bacterium]
MKKVNGAIVVNAERCKGCGLCVNACRLGLITMTKKTVNHKGYPYAEQQDWEKCNACRACAIVCPDGCITVYKSETSVD